MESIKNFFGNIEAENEKHLASIIKESISDRGFDSSALDEKIENDLDKIESEYKSQFISNDHGKTRDDNN
jgi:hypothetical protein